MFTDSHLRDLLSAQPFVPFRLHLSDGTSMDVKTRDVVLRGWHWAVIGILDPNASDLVPDRWITVWYLHVTKVEMLWPGHRPSRNHPRVRLKLPPIPRFDRSEAGDP